MTRRSFGQKLTKNMSFKMSDTEYEAISEFCEKNQLSYSDYFRLLVRIHKKMNHNFKSFSRTIDEELNKIKQ